MQCHNNDIACDMMIIGTGLTGLAAGVFAARKGIDAAIAGLTAEIDFASGLMDLLGVHPVAEGRILRDPWQGITELCRDEPEHPYAKLDSATIRKAVDMILAFLEEGGYPHSAAPDANSTMITPAGTLKPTYAVPHTMASGPAMLAKRSACLLVDFHGLRGYSARQIAFSLKNPWPDLRPVRVDFPGGSGELYAEHMARALDSTPSREALVAAVKPHLGDAGAVGFPAVLGIYRSLEVMANLQKGLGVPVFEIPTMLPAVTGLRLRNVFEQGLPSEGIRPFFQQRVSKVHLRKDGRWQIDIGDPNLECRVIAKSVVLCSGRFFGKGLHADRQGIREAIFDLPVVQPANRAQWHHRDLLDRRGHPVNRAGLEVDGRFQPLDQQGRPRYANLFAAGTILAHQDWMRQKCGSGLAFATAYGAVEAAGAYLNP